MAKPIQTTIKLQIPAGKANPAPPIGSTLGQHGVDIQQFCSRFNEETKELGGDVIPTVINIYEDRTFDFILKTPPASGLLKKAAGVDKGSGDILKQKVGTVTKKNIQEIAEKKMPDLNARQPDAAAKIIEGTARSMGLNIE